MSRVVFVVPALALLLGGCLSSGSNPNCRMTVLPGQGSFQMCTVGNVILLEPAGGGYVAQAPEAEPAIAAEPMPAEPALDADPALDTDPAPDEPSLDGEEPVVIN